MSRERDKGSEESAIDTSKLSDPGFLQELRLQMLKFAVLQLGDKSMAEDAVQEALIGALKNADSFGRRSALKTWVFAILKHKISDLLQQRQRTLGTGSLSGAAEDEESLDMVFDSGGAWATDGQTGRWSQPADALQGEHFWQVFESCLDALPENQARAFMMREFLEFESPEICRTLAITTSNLHVILYRARLRLRECLKKRWFQEGERS